MGRHRKPDETTESTEGHVCVCEICGHVYTPFADLVFSAPPHIPDVDWEGHQWSFVRAQG